MLQTDDAGVRLRAVLLGPDGRAAPWPEATRGLRPRSGFVLQGTLQRTPDGRVGGVVQVTSGS